MKVILSILLLIFSSSVYCNEQLSPRAPKECIDEMPYGIPIYQSQLSNLICRQAYMLQYDYIAKVPTWVAYVLRPENSVGCIKRSNSFSEDKSIPVPYRAKISDYSKSGYDIGHMANNADMSWNQIVEEESFILTNMTPQLPGFNRGIWKKLEELTRVWARDRNHSLMIYVGPIYSRKSNTIGLNRVVVPDGFYKIIIDMTTKEVLIFEFDHQSSTAYLGSFLSSIERVQSLTNILFPLPKKSKFSNKVWDSTTKTVSTVKKDICLLSR